jgi:hypothetical protein
MEDAVDFDQVGNGPNQSEIELLHNTAFADCNAVPTPAARKRGQLDCARRAPTGDAVSSL